MAHRYRGFGPGIPSITSLLLKWGEDEKNKVQDYELLINRYKNSRREKIHTEVLKVHGGIKEGTTKASQGEDDDRILLFKQALRALVKSMKPERPEASKSDTSVVKSKKAAIVIENTELVQTQGEQHQDGPETVIVGQLTQLEIKLEAYLGSEVLESDNEMDGANEMLTDILSRLREAKVWVVSTRLLQSKSQLVKNLRLASKLRVDEGSPYSKHVGDIALAAAVVVAEWKRLLAQE